MSEKRKEAVPATSMDAYRTVGVYKGPSVSGMSLMAVTLGSCRISTPFPPR